MSVTTTAPPRRTSELAEDRTEDADVLEREAAEREIERAVPHRDAGRQVGRDECDPRAEPASVGPLRDQPSKKLRR
jgi:hypothetical protein